MKRNSLVFVCLAVAVLALADCGGDTATVGRPTSDETAAGGSSVAAKWIKVVTMSGSGGNVMKKTAPFKLEGGEQKLVGKLTGDPQYGGGNWTLTGVGEYADVDFVDAGKPGKVNSRMYVAAGRYYLECNTANSFWKVTLYELR